MTYDILIVGKYPSVEVREARVLSIAGSRGALDLPVPFCHGWEVQDRPWG